MINTKYETKIVTHVERLLRRERSRPPGHRTSVHRVSDVRHVVWLVAVIVGPELVQYVFLEKTGKDHDD